jgi:hypothetical protein
MASLATGIHWAPAGVVVVVSVSVVVSVAVSPVGVSVSEPVVSEGVVSSATDPQAARRRTIARVIGWNI